MGPWLIEVHSRDELDVWLGDNPPTPYRPVVMVVRGDGAEIREFLPNALDAAKRRDGRVVVWVKDIDMTHSHEVGELFLTDREILAAVLTPGHGVSAWVYRGRTGVDDAEFAFQQAQV